MKLYKFLFFTSLIFITGFSINNNLIADEFDFDDDLEFGIDEQVNFDDGLVAVEDSSSLKSPSLLELIKRIDRIAIWNKTGVTRSRDPLFFIPFRFIRDRSGAYPYLFFNMSNTLNVKPEIVLNSTTIDILEEFLGGSTTIDNTEDELGIIGSVLPFIRRMTVQERRFGGIIEAGLFFDKFFAQLDTTLFLAERNFWLRSKKDRADLLRLTSYLDGFGKGEVVREIFGLGDTRIKAGYYDSVINKIKFNVGASAILPTSDFSNNDPKSVISSKAGDPRSKLINDLLNVAKYIMIDPKLGTNHCALGCFFDANVEVVPKYFDFWVKFSFDHYLKGDEHRFYNSLRNITLQDMLKLKVNTTIPEDFPLDDFFPQVLKVSLYPGDVFDATLGCNLKSGSLKLGTGIDFFVQGAERVKSIKSSNIDRDLFNIRETENFRIVQNKLFSELGYRRKLFGYEVNFGAGGDVTVFTKGTAYDWTAFGKASLIF